MAIQKIGISGAAEMDALLKQLAPDVAVNIGRRATRAGAEVIADEARRLVPVDTGELRDSIAVDVPTAKRQRGETVRALVGFLNPTSGRAHLTEFGTSKLAARPFMRPAMDAKAGDALDGMAKVLASGIIAAAKRLAKPNKR